MPFRFSRDAADRAKSGVYANCGGNFHTPK
jgi:hypothetical protein